MKVSKISNITLQIILGILVADVIAGMFHWFEDTYLDYCIDVPFLREISRDNELHHYFPRAMLAYSYLEHMTVSFPLGMFVLLLLYVVYRRVFEYTYFIITFAFFSITANIVHRFSHMRECENIWIIRVLQKLGIFCSHDHHSLHHRNVTEKYCVVTEYNNYVLDGIYFWRGLEYLIFIVTGVKPNRKPGYNEYSDIHNHMHENAKLKCPEHPTKKDVDELINNLDEYKRCM
jgi:hypothetical protein